MVECEYCNKQFNDGLTGLAEKQLHIILMHGEIVNESS